MKRYLKIAICFLLVFCLLLPTATAEELTGQAAYNAVNEIIHFIVQNYKYETSQEELLRAAFKDTVVENSFDFDRVMKKVFDTLDPYSTYYTPSEYQTFMEQVSGSFSGIGINALTQPGRILILSTISGGPAEAAGLHAGDLIVSVDGESIEALSGDEAIGRIRGEVNTQVKIGILRNGIPMEFTVTRAVVSDQEVEYDLMDAEIGYLKITAFNDHTDTKMKEALDYFDGQGVKKIILDLRNNGGGITDTALRCLDYFVPHGKKVLNISYHNPEDDITYTSHMAARSCPYKMVVLVNENTASAAEIVAGALQDNRVATVIGQPTYGKGTMQTLRGLKTGAGIKLTIAETITPNGERITEKIMPDEVVSNRKKWIDDSEFAPIVWNETFQKGSESEGVRAIEERLNVLGYFADTPDTLYDEKTESAVRQFQFTQNLELTGTVDLYTEIAINNIDYEIQTEVDVQKERAVSLLKGE